jgi:penicillin-binding protein 1A
VRHVATAVFAISVALCLVVFYCLYTLPVDGGLIIEQTPSALVLETGAGEVFATRGVFKGEKLTAADLPPNLARAVVAIEDRRFYEHSGVDLHGIARAAWRDFLAGHVREGGSTITQQLARMTTLTQDRTVLRKLQEILVAFWLEHQLSKDEILVRYLNMAYFGAGTYGVDAAARRYFGKPAKQLTLSESAMLAGLVRAPSQLAPNRNIEAARARAERVLAAMVQTGAITPEQAKAALAQPARLQIPPETPLGSNYFVDFASNEAKGLLGTSAADLRLKTTLDPDLQAIAERAVADHLEAEGLKKNASQAALIALAPNGAILAMVGGRDYDQSQFNRIAQSRRQPGSLFKLFVYLTALEQGFRPNSVVVDRPVRIGDWQPENFEGRFRGPVQLRTAFAESINTVAVQLGQAVGLDRVIETARRLGITSELPAVPSLVLGSAEVTPLEMAQAFASISAGTLVRPYSVQAIQGHGQVLYSRPPNVQAAPIVSGEARAGMLELLAAVVREGTGRAASVPGPVAGKTGTTQDSRDAWFIGFTPELTVAVWVGNDDNTPMQNETGGDIPARIWKDFVVEAAQAKHKTAPAAQSAPPAIPSAEARTTLATGTALHGVPNVIDSSSLEIAGQLIHLVGVAGEDGDPALQLRRFIHNRAVDCRPGGATGQYRCSVDGDDLSETVLINGGGRATSDAPPELQAAEQSARAGQLGVWHP